MYFMKPTNYLLVLFMVMYMIISLPILCFVWFLGGNNVFENFTKFGNQTIFKHD